MKGVMLSLCPEAQLVDLTHEIPPQSVVTGAFLLKSAMDYFPQGTVHLVVVDPGVGSPRKAVAVKARGRFFVGPDNGLLPAALEEWGMNGIVELTEKRYWLQNPSSTFHGRDVFAPAAAHLAKGVSFPKLGRRAVRLVPGEIPKPRKTKNGYEGLVLWVDRFGNLITNIEKAHVAAGARIQVGKTVIQGLKSHYATVKPGQTLALMGSSGHLEISVNSGRANESLKCGIGGRVLIF